MAFQWQKELTEGVGFLNMDIASVSKVCDMENATKANTPVWIVSKEKMAVLKEWHKVPSLSKG